jgi:hypothetical protein
VPIGYSLAWINEAPPGRVVREDYSGGHGITFGLVMAVDIWGVHSGGYMGFAYRGRYNWFDRKSEALADPAVQATESVRFETHGTTFLGGYGYRF